MKFCTQTQFDPLDRSLSFENLKIQDGGHRHFEKSQDRYIPDMVWPITAKLGKRWRILSSWPCWPSKFWNFINPRWWRLPFWQKNRKPASLNGLHHPTPSILPNKTANIIKQNWNQFLLVVKATALKQQISNFYPQILSTVGPQNWNFYSDLTKMWNKNAPAGAYPLRDFHKICRVCTTFQDALVVKMSLYLLEGLWSYGGF